MIGTVFPGAGPAQSAATTGQTYALTPQQKADLLDAPRDEAVTDAALGQALDGNPDHRIHGEVGALVGTHGTRAVFGTAAIPIGDNAGATVSFESSRYGDPRRH